MLEFPEDVPIPTDHRYVSFAKATKVSEEILNKSIFEKEIKNIDFLEKPNVVAKIWKEIDKISQKKTGKLIEKASLLIPLCNHSLTEASQIIGFVPVAPRWYIPAPATPSKPPLQPASATPLPKPEPIKPCKPPIRTEREQEPADVKPYWAPAQREPAQIPPQRDGPKVKTKGPSASSAPVSASSTKASPGPERLSLPVFLVSKRVHEVFERILSGGAGKGQLHFEDFEYVRVSVLFSRPMVFRHFISGDDQHRVLQTSKGRIGSHF